MLSLRQWHIMHCAAVLQVAVALKGAVYLWNASSGSIETVCTTPMHMAMHLIVFMSCSPCMRAAAC